MATTDDNDPTKYRQHKLHDVKRFLCLQWFWGRRKQTPEAEKTFAYTQEMGMVLSTNSSCRNCNTKYTHLTINRATFAENCLFLRLDEPYLAKVIGIAREGQNKKWMNRKCTYVEMGIWNKMQACTKMTEFERTSTSHRRRHAYRTHQKLLLIQSESTVQGKKWLDTSFNVKGPHTKSLIHTENVCPLSSGKRTVASCLSAETHIHRQSANPTSG